MNLKLPCCPALQARGLATFADDTPAQKGSLYAAYVCARVAAGTVQAVDISAAMQVPGAVRFVGPADIPGSNVVSFQGKAAAGLCG